MAKVMNSKDKKVWIDALRSGKFTQGEGRLYSKSPDTYCCLGVAQCILTGKNPNIGDYYLSTKMTKRLGLSLDLQAALAIANDGYAEKNEHEDVRQAFFDVGYTSFPKDVVKKAGKYRSSFKHIADWIEKNL